MDDRSIFCSHVVTLGGPQVASRRRQVIRKTRLRLEAGNFQPRPPFSGKEEGLHIGLIITHDCKMKPPFKTLLDARVPRASGLMSRSPCLEGAEPQLHGDGPSRTSPHSSSGCSFVSSVTSFIINPYKWSIFLSSVSLHDTLSSQRQGCGSLYL